MNQGLKTIIYPVKDIAQAKALYRALLGVEPIMDAAYYVGFKVGDQDIGLDPNGHAKGMTGPVGYWHVNDIQKSLQLLLDAGGLGQAGRLHGLVIRQERIRIRSCGNRFHALRGGQSTVNRASSFRSLKSITCPCSSSARCVARKTRPGRCCPWNRW